MVGHCLLRHGDLDRHAIFGGYHLAHHVPVQAHAAGKLLVLQQGIDHGGVLVHNRRLAAVTQRRDSITAQLANVRQMLATLGGGAVLAAVEPEPEAPVEEEQQDDVDETVVEADDEEQSAGA